MSTIKIKISIFSSILLLCIFSCTTKNSTGNNEIKIAHIQNPQIVINWEGLLTSPWPMYQHDPQHTGQSPHVGPQEGVVVWTYDTGAEVFSTPIIDDIGNIYVGSNSMNFFALNPVGHLLWSFPLEGKNYYTTPLLDSKKNIYLSPNGSSFLHSLSTLKKINWTIELPGIDFTSFNISQDGSTLYTIGFSEKVVNREVGHLYALDTDNGQVLWQNIYTEEQGVYGEPAIGPDQTIYCTSYSGSKVYAINPDGTIKWEYNIANSTGSLLATSCPSIDSDGNIYVNNSSRLICINPSGLKKWHFDKIDHLANIHPPTIAGDGTIYLVIQPSVPQLIAFDSIGQVKWKTEIDESTGNIVCAPVVDSEGTIYLGLMPGYHDPEYSVNFAAIHPDGTIKYKLALSENSERISDISLPPSLSASGIAYVGLERPMGTRLYAIK